MAYYKFGIDIDGTVTDPATFIPHLNRHFNKNLTLDDIVEYDLTQVLGISHQTFSDWMSVHEPSIYEQADIAADARNILHDWKKHHKLYYISARPAHVHDITTRWFKSFDVPYDHIELLGKHDKLNTVKKFGLDIFFEDKHDNACQIAEECGIPVILMDTPYNQLSIPENVYRACNWRQAGRIVENIFQHETSAGKA